MERRRNLDKATHPQREASIPGGAAPLESILCTEELRRRPARPADHEKENRALVALASALADSKSDILQTLAQTIRDVTDCDSSGLSLLTRGDGGKRFYWPAIVGMWQPYIGGGTPRNFGPCGDVLDRDCTLLFKHFERRYPYLQSVTPSAEECLLVPFYVRGKPAGTIWAVMHSDRRQFDAEDERIMISLGQFASVAYQTLDSIEDLEIQIAAREKAETGLRERTTGLEAKVRRLVEANVIGIVIWNLEGAFTDANEAFLQMVQFGRDDLVLGQVRWTDLTPAEYRELDARAIAELHATGTFQPFEKEYYRRDGSRVPVLLGGALFEKGGNEGVAFILDLSERKDAEEAVRTLERQDRAILDSALDAVAVMDASGIITGWNKRAEEIFGWTRPEAIGRRMSETIIPLSYRPAHEAGLGHFLKTGEGRVLNKRIEVTALRRDGSEFPVELTITPLKSDDSWTFSSFIRDISDRRHAEEKLRESELSLRNAQAELAHVNRVMTMGELTASIAHEVNQPLSAIIASGDSCSAWLSNDPPNLDKARAATGRIIQAATQASEIVQRLRALFNKTSSITAPIDINAVIEDTISLIHHETERKKILLCTELDATAPTVSGDRVQLQQVILNLAMNGIESIAGLDRQPKRLMIRSSVSSAGELLVSVEDTGRGIQAEDADRVFAPFFTTKTQGIGMGLSICRSIIEAHGGRLWATANEPRGAAFHFALPVIAPSE